MKEWRMRGFWFLILGIGGWDEVFLVLCAWWDVWGVRRGGEGVRRGGGEEVWGFGCDDDWWLMGFFKRGGGCLFFGWGFWEGEGFDLGWELWLVIGVDLDLDLGWWIRGEHGRCRCISWKGVGGCFDFYVGGFLDDGGEDIWLVGDFLFSGFSNSIREGWVISMVLFNIFIMIVFMVFYRVYLGWLHNKNSSPTTKIEAFNGVHCVFVLVMFNVIYIEQLGSDPGHDPSQTNLCFEIDIASKSSNQSRHATSWVGRMHHALLLTCEISISSAQGIASWAPNCSIVRVAALHPRSTAFWIFHSSPRRFCYMYSRA